MHPSLRLFLATGLALSIGWGIRGNFGHEFGALLPGALASLTAVLMSGRGDWQPRVLWAGLFGAVGWSFGGSISYMQVIAYTHSGHSGTIAYGFACLFLIGFLWAAPGGAGLGLALELPRARLLEIPPMLALLAAVWTAQTGVEIALAHQSDFRHEDVLYWYDTDWLAALTALAAALGRRVWIRRWDVGSSLVFWLAVGWWAGFLLFPNLLGWRMTPPRGDSWAGMLGLVAGLILWLRRQSLGGSLTASLWAGAVGGVGFAGAALLETLELKSGAQTNWHSILEQTYGLINGFGLAWVVLRLRTRLPAPDEAGPAGRGWLVGAAAFLLVGIPWLNLQKNPPEWVRGGMPASFHGIPVETWFHGAMALLLALFLYLGRSHLRTGLALVPVGWKGRGQLVLLGLLALMLTGNLLRALPGFQAQRLVTEGVLQVNACLLVALVIGAGATAVLPDLKPDWSREVRRALVGGLALAIFLTAVPWGLVRLVYGARPVGFHRLHIRFGPDATATSAKPRPGQPHP
jgi:hypothetical protein